MGLRCFLVVPSLIARRSLRRYRNGRWDAEGKRTVYEPPCPGPRGYHDASVEIERGTCHPGEPDAERDGRRSWVMVNPDGTESMNGDLWPHHDERWPRVCAACPYEFDADDNWQLNFDVVYVDPFGGQHSLADRTPGMMWNADWMPDRWKGLDGRCMVAVLPGGHEWMIDGPASNCTLPDDDLHRCWIRHGTPPLLTVNKAGGPDASAIRTCAAGAGSVQAGSYHGFLVNGEFV